MARRKRKNALQINRRRKNALMINRKRRKNTRKRRNTGLETKIHMGSLLVGAGLAYFFNKQLKDLIGQYVPQYQGGQAAQPSFSAEEAQMLALEAEALAAQNQVLAEEASLGALHMNPNSLMAEYAARNLRTAVGSGSGHGYGAIQLNPGYGAIQLNPHGASQGSHAGPGYLSQW